MIPPNPGQAMPAAICEELMGTVDPGIAPYVAVLRAAGVETFESCQGGDGHAFPEPTIRFHGEHAEGFRALGVALQRQLRGNPHPARISTSYVERQNLTMRQERVHFTEGWRHGEPLAPKLGLIRFRDDANYLPADRFLR